MPHGASIQLARQADNVIENSTRDLRDALQRPEYTSQAKSDFFAKVSHELCSPINGIPAMSDLLNPINDIVDYSCIGAGKLQLAPIEFDVH